MIYMALFHPSLSHSHTFLSSTSKPLLTPTIFTSHSPPPLKPLLFPSTILNKTHTIISSCGIAHCCVRQAAHLYRHGKGVLLLEMCRCPHRGQPSLNNVVKGLDLQRYMGRWYEIASFPSRLQPKNGENTRATYTLRNDRSVNVFKETWTDGKRGCMEGTAYKADPSSDEAMLKVKFHVPPLLPIIPVVGDYWVLYIDEDYQYALIGQPSRKYLWILSRQSHLDDEIYNQLVQRAKDEDYDVSKLHRTPQSDSPPEGEEGPKDTKGIWWFKSILGI